MTTNSNFVCTVIYKTDLSPWLFNASCHNPIISKTIDSSFIIMPPSQELPYSGK